MKVAVFSDVHGNLPALEIMLRHCQDVDAFLCLGDLVNYGPWSEECVQRVAALDDCTCLLGNHEAYFLQGRYEGSHPLPALFFEQCYPGFRSFDYLRSLPLETRLGAFRFTHTLEDRNIYPDTEIALSENTCIGHSHHQFSREIAGFRLVNVGSVGQNRAFIDCIAFAFFYPESNHWEFHQIPYDVEVLLKEMRRRNFPEACLEYYLAKPRKGGAGPAPRSAAASPGKSPP